MSKIKSFQEWINSPEEGFFKAPAVTNEIDVFSAKRAWQACESQYLELLKEKDELAENRANMLLVMNQKTKEYEQALEEKDADFEELAKKLTEHRKEIESLKAQIEKLKEYKWKYEGLLK